MLRYRFDMVFMQCNIFHLGVEYMALLLTLFIELILFLFHLHGRPEVDKHLHMLLVYSIAACIVSVTAEMIYPTSINAAIAR